MKERASAGLENPKQRHQELMQFPSDADVDMKDRGK